MNQENLFEDWDELNQLQTDLWQETHPLKLASIRAKIVVVQKRVYDKYSQLSADQRYELSKRDSWHGIHMRSTLEGVVKGIDQETKRSGGFKV